MWSRRAIIGPDFCADVHSLLSWYRATYQEDIRTEVADQLLKVDHVVETFLTLSWKFNLRSTICLHVPGAAAVASAGTTPGAGVPLIADVARLFRAPHARSAHIALGGVEGTPDMRF
jgi:hypothetical protein